MKANPALAGLDIIPIAMRMLTETLREINSLSVDIDARAHVETGGDRPSRQGRF